MDGTDRLVYGVLTGCALLVVAVVAVNTLGGAGDGGDAAAPSSTRAAASAAPTPGPAPVLAPATGVALDGATTSPAAEVSGESVTVARVVDGDTLRLADGRTVRLLGIDSCEMGTYGGQEAKTAAEAQLAGAPAGSVTLIAEPSAPDKDRYGRLLRYVSVGGVDLGEHLVQFDHTGIYQGSDNDASPEYLRRLYAADLAYASNPPAGRDCADPYPSSGGGPDVSVGEDDDRNHRDGALTGGFCRGRWWC